MKKIGIVVLVGILFSNSAVMAQVPRVKHTKQMNQAHKREYGKGIHKKRGRGLSCRGAACAVNQYRMGTYVPVDAAEYMSVDDAQRALIVALDTMCKRYRIKLSQKQRSKQVNRIEAMVHDFFGKPGSKGARTTAHARDVRKLKRSLKTYLKVLYPQNFSQTVQFDDSVTTWKQAKKQIKIDLMDYMKKDLGLTQDSGGTKAIWDMMKIWVVSHLDQIAVFDEMGLVIIDQVRFAQLKKDAQNECKRLFDLRNAQD